MSNDQAPSLSQESRLRKAINEAQNIQSRILEAAERAEGLRDRLEEPTQAQAESSQPKVAPTGSLDDLDDVQRVSEQGLSRLEEQLSQLNRLVG